MTSNTKKNRITALLAAALLASALVSCGETASSGAENTAALPEGNGETQTVTEEGNGRTPVGLSPDLDFGGAEFHSAALEWQGFRYYFFADEDNGEVMNTAIYERTMEVEETLNVDLTHEFFKSSTTLEVPDAIVETVLAGEDRYQHALVHCIGGVAMLSSGGYLYNLDLLPNIDMTAEWWNQKQMDTLRLGKNTYYAVNDYLLPTPYILYFSKALVEQYDMEDPYQLVYDGKWTLDAFASMCKTVVKDLNGDGKMAFTDDCYAISCNEGSKYGSFAPGCDQFITEKDPQTGLRLICNTEKMVHICEVFAELANMKATYIPQGSEYDLSVQLTIDTGRLLFQMGDLSQCEQFRDYTVEFGFLPYPKYDEAQDGYHSLDWGGLLCIPTTITNPEMVGAVTELLAYVSGDTVVPTYYDTVLTGKLTRDEDARKMLDIIFDTICYDVGSNYFSYDASNGGWQSPFTKLFQAVYNLSVAGKQADYASFYAKNEAGAMKSIGNFFAALDAAEAES